MSKREAPVRFHDWCGARDRKAATRRRWRSRCIRLVAVPVSIGLAALVLAAGSSSFCTRGSQWRKTFRGGKGSGRAARRDAKRTGRHTLPPPAAVLQ
jgi:hypothetical protein